MIRSSWIRWLHAPPITGWPALVCAFAAAGIPTAVRAAVSGLILVKPAGSGVKQEPPLPVAVELEKDAAPQGGLAEAIARRIREALVFTAQVELVPFGSLQRSEYKSKLVQH